MIVGGKLAPGDVLVHHNFMFNDGNVATSKLLVIYGERAGSDVLFFIATSQEKWGRHKKSQCQPQDCNPSSFFAPARSKQFSEDTWIVLEPEQWASSKFVARLDAGRCFRTFSLPQQDYHALKNCFVRCPEFAEVYREFR